MPQEDKFETARVATDKAIEVMNSAGGTPEEYIEMFGEKASSHYLHDLAHMIQVVITHERRSN